MTPTTRIHRTKSRSVTFLPAIRRMLTRSASAPPRFRRIWHTAITLVPVTDRMGRRVQPLPVTRERLDLAIQAAARARLAKQPEPILEQQNLIRQTRFLH